MVLPGRDVPWKGFLKRLYNEWNEDAASDVAGGVTFFVVLALFPFLAFLIGVASLVITPEHVTALIGQLRTVAPPAVTDLANERLQALATSEQTGLLTVGGIGALWATTSGITAVMRALNTAYGVKEGRPFWKVRVTAAVMALVLAMLAILAAFVVVAAPPLAERFGGVFETAINFARIPVAALVMLLAWALAYYVLPDVEQEFKFITPGSVVGVVLWVVASWGFSQYVQSFASYDATYGSLGAAIILLMWMWISAQVLLLGAEINALLEHMSEEGKAPGAKRMEDKGVGVRPEAEGVPAHALLRPRRAPASRAPRRSRFAKLAAFAGTAFALRRLRRA